MSIVTYQQSDAACEQLLTFLKIPKHNRQITIEGQPVSLESFSYEQILDGKQMETSLLLFLIDTSDPSSEELVKYLKQFVCRLTGEFAVVYVQTGNS